MTNKNVSPNSPRWMIAYTTHDITEAHIIVGRLQSEGITAILDHMAGRDAIGLTIGNWGEVRVLVSPADYEQAVEILQGDDTAELPEGSDDIIYYNPDDPEDDADQ